jgi:nucleotide-binding universal stress UspA family protein
MLSKLLLATDASDASDRVVDCVRHLRGIGGREALLVHVLNVRDIGGLSATVRRAILPRLEAQQQALAAAGFHTQIEIPLGIPFHEINRLVAEHGASAIVVGSHGESLLKEMWLGSTACSILHNARVPVLLARIEITAEEGAERCRAACAELFHHVLFPTDFSDIAERAFQYLEHIVREAHPAVTLLHVQDASKLGAHLKERLDEFNAIDRGRLERMRDRLLACGARSVELDLPYGSPIGILLDRAKGADFSLVVMGTQGRGFIREIFLGSVAHNMARYAPLPVLFVPPGHRGPGDRAEEQAS